MTLAAMSHSPEAGRAALALVMEALEGLRPDIALTVLATASVSVSMMVPDDRRNQLWIAYEAQSRSIFMRASGASCS